MSIKPLLNRRVYFDDHFGKLNWDVRYEDIAPRARALLRVDADQNSRDYDLREGIQSRGLYSACGSAEITCKYCYVCAE